MINAQVLERVQVFDDQIVPQLIPLMENHLSKSKL
jgi:hypothetical protein